MSKARGNTPIQKIAKLVLIALMGAVLIPMIAAADSADEIKAKIMQDYADTQENLTEDSEGVSKHGSVEFWSSGGLMQYVPADAPAGSYEQFSVTPKHIKVITLVEDQAAIAMYYSEGSIHRTGLKPVSHYMTRVTEAYAKEDGEWKQRAAHYSPIASGQGTEQTSLD